MIHGAVNARMDDAMLCLLFVTVEDAKSFIKLCQLYQNESGAGNGYGAYWVFNDSIEETDGNSDRFTRSLEQNRIREMIDQVVHARSAGDRILHYPALAIGESDSAIVFLIKDFADRVSPAAGDMFRVVDWEVIPDTAQKVPGEGRVIEIMGDSEMARVIGCFDEAADGTPKPNVQVVEVPLKAIMKIPDWLKASHKQRR